MALYKQSIGRKVLMALSGLFLVLFLAQHLTINMTSVFSPEQFNRISHFMGTNFIVQFVLQPVLIAGTIVHFLMGFALEVKNRSSRSIAYVAYKGNKNASWISRNMIWSGAVVLSFLGLHFYDFWIPEINRKYIAVQALNDSEHYYSHLVAQFESPVRIAFYAVSFIFLSLHLLHGFLSSFRSLGARTSLVAIVKPVAVIFSIVVPLGFVFIAIFHYLSNQ